MDCAISPSSEERRQIKKKKFDRTMSQDFMLTDISLHDRSSPIASIDTRLRRVAECQ
jgi:hypothetical protein